MLVDAGAEIEARDEEGRTPLYSAVENKRPLETVAVLLDAAADPGTRQQQGLTPLHAAMRSNPTQSEFVDLELIPALLDAGGRSERNRR